MRENGKERENSMKRCPGGPSSSFKEVVDESSSLCHEEDSSKDLSTLPPRLNRKLYLSRVWRASRCREF
jgi:hypothetical protein